MDIKDSYLHGTVGVVKSISVDADKLQYKLADIAGTVKEVTLPVATISANGLMSSGDKTKLDSLSSTIGNYVTLDTNQDITGTKTFTTQLKFTVAKGTAPFQVTSDTKVTNLNADLLDGLHHTDFVRNYGIVGANYSKGCWLGYTYSNKEHGAPVAGGVISVGASSGMQIVGHHGGSYLYYRGINGSNFTEWKQIAFIDSNITGNAATADKVKNDLIWKINSGTTEGTDLYTYNGSAAKTLDIKLGSNITLTAETNSLTITASDTKVTQTNTTGSASYRVLFSGNANDTTETTTTRKSANLLFNPSTGKLTVGHISTGGDIIFTGSNKDQYLYYYHNDAWAWRTGHQGTGTSNTNYFVIQNQTSGTVTTSLKIDYNAASKATFIGTVVAPTFQGNLDGTYVNALTGYSKATSAADLAATDTLNAALGKLEYKADTAYSWYRTITDDDTDEIINKWDEVVDFVNNLEVDLTEEFVTRKTDLTITGVKTFQSISSGSAVTINNGLLVIATRTYGGWDRGITFNNTDTNTSGETTTVRADIGVFGSGYGSLHTGNNRIEYLYMAHLGQLYSNAVFKVYSNKATISNNEIYHKGNLKNLSDLNDDVVSGNYLPLTGGTMKGPITLTSGGTLAYEKTALSFTNADGSREDARIGTSDSGHLAIYSRQTIYLKPDNLMNASTTTGITLSSTKFTYNTYNVLHEGNYSSYLGYIGTTQVLSAAKALALEGITNATMSGITTTDTLVISRKTNAKHIMFSRGSATDYPYNYIAAPAGGLICILPNGAENSSAGGMQFSVNGLHPATSLGYSLGTSSLLWNAVYANTFHGSLKGNADSASKLTTVSKTAWGLTYWTSGGVPTSISGDMTSVGNITMSGDILINAENTDKFLIFAYANLDRHSWKIGYLGTGTGESNYLVILGNGLTSGGSYVDVLRFSNGSFDATFAGNILPAVNNTKTLGTSSLKWANVYATEGNYTGNVVLESSTASAVTPKIYFKRGTTSDSYYDSYIYNSGGSITFGISYSGTNYDKCMVSDTSFRPTTDNVTLLGRTTERWADVNTVLLNGYTPITSNNIGSYAWTSDNDGTGSGLDADLLDGKHASEFALSSELGNYLPLSGGTLHGDLYFDHTSSSVKGNIGWIQGTYHERIQINDFNTTAASTFTFLISTDSGSTWTDLLQIKNNGTIVATTFLGKLAYTNLTGSGTTANQAIVSTGTANGWTLKTLGSNAFNSTAYLPLSGGTITGTLTIKRAASVIKYVHTDNTVYGYIGFNAKDTPVVYMGNGSTVYNLIHSGNYTDYTVKKDGTGASGTWNINISGNAGSASNVTVLSGSSSSYRAIVVHNGNALYSAGTGSGKPQYNYSTGDIKAKSFTTDGGNFNGNATTATTLKSTTIVSDQEFSLSNSEWTNTGYTFASLATGTYAIQVTSGSNLVASGIMSVYKNLEDSAGDEIPLHVYSNAGWRPYLRTYANKLLISSNDATALPRKVTIKIALIL